MTFPFSASKLLFLRKKGDFSDAISKGGDEHITLKAVKDRFGLSAEIWAGELREVEGCHPGIQKKLPQNSQAAP